jgi:hypothetical protein
MAIYAGEYTGVLYAGNSMGYVANSNAAFNVTITKKSDGSTPTLYTSRTKGTALGSNVISVGSTSTLNFYADPGTYTIAYTIASTNYSGDAVVPFDGSEFAAYAFFQGSFGTQDGTSTAFTNNNAFNTVNIANVISDPSASWSATNHNWTVPVTGWYDLGAAVRPVDSGTSGVNVCVGIDAAAATTNGAWYTTPVKRGSFIYNRKSHQTAGDVMRLYTYVDNSGTSLSFNFAAFTIALLSQG